MIMQSSFITDFKVTAIEIFLFDIFISDSPAYAFLLAINSTIYQVL